MDTILFVGLSIIFGLAALGVFLGWKHYHEKGKAKFEEFKDIRGRINSKIDDWGF